jgi:Pyridoxamine 5'-phosphate oxidase
MFELNDVWRSFLQGRRIATFATRNTDNGLHLTAVWYIFEDDCFYLAVSSRSHKWKNCIVRPQVSLMVDSRIPAKECGITAIGLAETITGDESEDWNRKVHAHYLTPDAILDPMVGGVYAAGDDVTIKIVPQKWLTWDIGIYDTKSLGGRLSSHNYVFPLDL